MLLKLAADIEDSHDEPDKAVRLILDWCGRFGLLGILPHTAIRIDLPVRYLDDDSSFTPVFRAHTRTGGRWISKERPGAIPRSIWEEGGLEEVLTKLQDLRYSQLPSEGKPKDVSQILSKMMDIPPNELARLKKALTNLDLPLADLVQKDDPDDYREPTVAFDSETWAAETMTEGYPLPLATILRYFPDFSGDGEEFECPAPLSPEFWRQYREGLFEFYGFIRGFFQAAGGLNSKPSLADLEDYIKPAGVSLSRGSDDRVEERWMCPSLLSLFGRMLIQDMSAGKRILRCDCCGSPFVTDNYQARYCSRRCGFRLRQRRARAKATGAVSTEDQNGKEAR
jgi:hypothetical protein